EVAVFGQRIDETDRDPPAYRRERVHLARAEIRLDQAPERGVLGRIHSVRYRRTTRDDAAEGLVVLQHPQHVRMPEKRYVAVVATRDRAAAPHVVERGDLVPKHRLRPWIPVGRRIPAHGELPPLALLRLLACSG